MEIKRGTDATILVLCVNFRNDAETRRFVQAIADCPSRADHVLAISNSPEESTDSLGVLNAIAGVQVLLAEKNLGYFRAAALGLREFLKTHPLPEWIIVSNTDITFHDQEMFGKLRSEYPGVPPAVVAPDVVANYTGRLSVSALHQNPYMRKRPEQLKMQGFYLVTRSYAVYALYELFTKIKNTLRNKLVGRDRSESGHKAETIYAPYGAFFIFNRRFFEAGASLDYGAFLYGEEVFVAELARRLSLDVVYNPRLAVTHSHQKPSTLFPSRLHAAYIRDAMGYLVNTFFGRK